MSDSQEVSKMVGIYKKLFLILLIVTAVGMAIAFLHLPVWGAIIIALAIIAIKGKVVLDSFKHLLVGRNALIIIFGMTGIFVLGLLLGPVLNHKDYLVGTQEVSDEASTAAPPAEGKHGH